MEFSKLQIMLAEELGKDPDSVEVTAVIEITANWFEFVLEQMGLAPSCIPTLLRWQYLQGQYEKDTEDLS